MKAANIEKLEDGWVTRPNGERVRVKIRRPPGQPIRRLRQGTFVQVPLPLVAEFAAATNTRKAMVWLSLLYAAWEAKYRPFTFSQDKLVGKCSRQLKRRVLSELEKAGWIRVEQKNGRAPVVTLLKVPATMP
jgi:hypothetical protein